MLPDPPVPILATWIPIPRQVIVTFDRPLLPGPLDPNNWLARRTNLAHTGQAPAVAAGAVASCRMLLGMADIGPDTVTYTAAVPDVQNLAGVPAAAFADFPIQP